MKSQIRGTNANKTDLKLHAKQWFGDLAKLAKAMNVALIEAGLDSWVHHLGKEFFWIGEDEGRPAP